MIKERCPVDVVVGAENAERDAKSASALNGVQGKKPVWQCNWT